MSDDRKPLSASFMPTMRDLMTPNPLTVDQFADFREAEAIMKGKRIRHLPVVHKDKLVGILSDRDVKLATGFAQTLEQKIAVGEICTENPLTVGPDATLAEVGNIMLQKKIGCLLITDQNNGKLIGIFTEFDAIRAMMAML